MHPFCFGLATTSARAALRLKAGRQLYASARHTHHISGEQSFTPTSAGFGNRVLVGDPLHNSARNGSTIDKFCETAVIDRLLLPFAEQLRRVSNRILYQFEVERHGTPAVMAKPSSV